MKSRVLIPAAAAGAALIVALGNGMQDAVVAQGRVRPVFEVDPHFLKMPAGMVLGAVGGATADGAGNVWINNRPHTLPEANALLNGYKPGPPILQFSEKGTYIRGWGGPAANGEYQWTNRGGLFSAFAPCQSCTQEHRGNGDGRPGSGEHGIFVDHKNNVWITGNGDDDGQILKFTADGKFLLQIGKAGVAVDSNSTTTVSRAAGVYVYPKTNEAFVSDGYGNRRVVVFDADTGAYKRHWGAYGNRPDDKASNRRTASGAGPQQFNTVHGIAISEDGILYVADRGNNRVQSFRIDGTFLKEAFVKRESEGTGTAFGVALSREPGQRFLYVADGSNERIAILDRAALEEIGSIGRPGRNAGEFYHLHSIATDMRGNIITGESQGYRVQKFIYKGLSSGGTN